jgi:MscS family membrane protein
VKVFFEVADRAEELAAREEFILAVLRLAEELGVAFAYPTHTVRLSGGPAPVR